MKGKITVSVQRKYSLFTKALHMNKHRVSSYIQHIIRMQCILPTQTAMYTCDHAIHA